jgi:hypothetical protein
MSIRTKYPGIAEAIRAELDDIEFGFKDLGRFKKRSLLLVLMQEQQFVEIALNNVDEQMTILPDNGHLYVKVEVSRKGENTLLVTFAGIGGTFSAFYNKEQQCFVGGLPPRVRPTSISGMLRKASSKFAGHPDQTWASVSAYGVV